MKVRELIERLAKQNWDAEVVLDLREKAEAGDFCSTPKEIKSISNYRLSSSHSGKRKPFVSLNIKGI